MNQVLAVRDLAVHFDTRHGTVQAVRQLDLDLAKGEVVGIVGESGSGKSVSVLSMLGLAPASASVVAGTAEFEGENLLAMSPKRMRQVRGNDIAMVFQDPISSLNPLMTIGAQVGEVLSIHRPELSREQRKTMVIDLLTRVRIPEAASRYRNYPHELSGGMRQRVMIAQALACDPTVLIADEPTTALDVTIQRQILELLLELREQTSMSIIFITHDLGVVAELCDRVVVMYGGLVMETAELTELMSRPRHPYTIGLMGCAPDLDQDRDAALTPIPGSPPDMLDPPPGCPFAPRCPVAMEICHQQLPELHQIMGHHQSRCWLASPQVPAAVAAAALADLAPSEVIP